MSASLIYTFHHIPPNTEMSIFIGGLKEDFTTFSLIVFRLGWAGIRLNYGVRASLRHDEFARHSGGTMGRLVYVRNMELYYPCTADLLLFEQSL